MSKTCNLCDCAQSKFLFTRSDEVFGKQDVRECINCGLVFVTPLPEISKLKDHYSDFFFTEKFDYVESGKIWERFYELNLEYIERIKNKGRLLEIGCGLGHFLSIAKRKGWDASGVELSEFASNYAKEQFGLNIFNGLLEKAKFPDNHFDVVALWATLEHLIDPVKELIEICRILSPGGLLVLSVPNNNSFHTRVLGMQNTDMKHFEHNYQFPFNTLKILLDKTGFERLRRIIIFGGSPNNSRFEDLKQFVARRLNIGNEIRIAAFKKREYS